MSNSIMSDERCLVLFLHYIHILLGLPGFVNLNLLNRLREQMSDFPQKPVSENYFQVML